MLVFLEVADAVGRRDPREQVGRERGHEPFGRLATIGRGAEAGRGECGGHVVQVEADRRRERVRVRPVICRRDGAGDRDTEHAAVQQRVVVGGGDAHVTSRRALDRRDRNRRDVGVLGGPHAVLVDLVHGRARRRGRQPGGTAESGQARVGWLVVVVGSFGRDVPAEPTQGVVQLGPTPARRERVVVRVRPPAGDGVHRASGVESLRRDRGELGEVGQVVVECEPVARALVGRAPEQRAAARSVERVERGRSVGCIVRAAAVLRERRDRALRGIDDPAAHVHEAATFRQQGADHHPPIGQRRQRKRARVLGALAAQQRVRHRPVEVHTRGARRAIGERRGVVAHACEGHRALGARVGHDHRLHVDRNEDPLVPREAAVPRADHVHVDVELHERGPAARRGRGIDCRGVVVDRHGCSRWRKVVSSCR